MKFAENGSLQENAASLRHEPRKCVQLMAKVAHAVDYAHSRGVLHRDNQTGKHSAHDEASHCQRFRFGQAAGREQRSYKVADYVRNRRFYCPEQAVTQPSMLSGCRCLQSRRSFCLTCLPDVHHRGFQSVSVIRKASESRHPNYARWHHRSIEIWKRFVHAARSDQKRATSPPETRS